jgi:hypothetical protein
MGRHSLRIGFVVVTAGEQNSLVTHAPVGIQIDV